MKDPIRKLLAAASEPAKRRAARAAWVTESHLALHRWFKMRGRPVPAFVVLDQPSKAHYPPSERFDAKGIEDDDRKAVVRLFKFLCERADRDGFQIIVVDHADEPLDWFQDAVVERWRHGEKLVPDAWPEAQAPDA